VTDQGVTLQKLRTFGREFKKIPATTAGNFIGLHGRNAGYFHGFGSGRLDVKKGGWFWLINTTKLSQTWWANFYNR